MKELKIFMLFLFATSVAMAQDLNTSDLPEEVSNAFAKDNANAQHVEWERDKENYKVEFYMGLSETEIWYDELGTMIKKKQDLNAEQLPQSISEVLKSEFKDYRVDDVDMVWLDNATTYNVEVDNGKEEWEITFDSDGKILEKRRD